VGDFTSGRPELTESPASLEEQQCLLENIAHEARGQLRRQLQQVREGAPSDRLLACGQLFTATCRAHTAPPVTDTCHLTSSGECRSAARVDTLLYALPRVIRPDSSTAQTDLLAPLNRRSAAKNAAGADPAAVSWEQFTLPVLRKCLLLLRSATANGATIPWAEWNGMFLKVRGHSSVELCGPHIAISPATIRSSNVGRVEWNFLKCAGEIVRGDVRAVHHRFHWALTTLTTATCHAHSRPQTDTCHP